MASHSLRLPRFSANCRRREGPLVAIALNAFAQERPRVNRFARQIQPFADQFNGSAQRHERKSLVQQRVCPTEIRWPWLRWSNNHRHFASRRIGIIEGGEVLKISAMYVLVELGQFARNSDLASAKEG